MEFGVEEEKIKHQRYSPTELSQVSLAAGLGTTTGFELISTGFEFIS